MNDLYAMINTWFSVFFFFSITLLGFILYELIKIRKILQKSNGSET